MYQLLLLAVIHMAKEVTSEGMASCARLQHGIFQCCRRQRPSLRMPLDSYRQECNAIISERPTPCEVELCVSKRRGLVSDNGTFNVDKMSEDVENNFENDPELVDGLKKYCIYGNVTKFGPEHMCDVLKQRVCFEVQLIKSCDRWDNLHDCKGMQNLARRCVLLFENNS